MLLIPRKNCSHSCLSGRKFLAYILQWGAFLACKVLFLVGFLIPRKVKRENKSFIGTCSFRLVSRRIQIYVVLLFSPNAFIVLENTHTYIYSWGKPVGYFCDRWNANIFFILIFFSFGSQSAVLQSHHLILYHVTDGTRKTERCNKHGYMWNGPGHKEIENRGKQIHTCSKYRFLRWKNFEKIVIVDLIWLLVRLGAISKPNTLQARLSTDFN